MATFIVDAPEFTFSGNRFIFSGAGPNHNGMYRGKNLGTITSSNIDSFVAEHEISEGKFADLYLGDYFVIQDGTYNKEWMIAGFDMDYMRNMYGDDPTYTVQNHHIFIIPKGPGVVKGRMHSTNSTAGGIYNSEIYSTLNNTILPKFTAVLGNHISDQCSQVVSAADNTGVPTSARRGVVTIQLPKMVQIYGYINYEAADWTSGQYYEKLPIYNFIPRMVSSSVWNDGYWLADIFDGSHFETVIRKGQIISSASASSADLWIRPILAIK